MDRRKFHIEIFLQYPLRLYNCDRIKDACHEKIDLKVFVVVIPEEGWARVV